ncbi:fork head domain-containing protein [Mucor lusitanicus]
MDLNTSSSSEGDRDKDAGYLPPIPVMMRHPYIVASVKQYRSEAQNEQLQHHIIYTWITARYPALYNAEDTGWQNTIRHNLSLNRCFKKVPKSELVGTSHRGKGGYWTIDPTQMEKFKNGAFAKGLPDTPVSTLTNNTPKDNANITHSSPETSPPQPTVVANNEPCPVMQIHNLLN